jgi:cyclic lactone autoinducer peptide
VKQTIIVKCARSIERIASIGAGKACMGLWHQPKVPKALQKH